MGEVMDALEDDGGGESEGEMDRLFGSGYDAGLLDGRRSAFDISYDEKVGGEGGVLLYL